MSLHSSSPTPKRKENEILRQVAPDTGVDLSIVTTLYKSEDYIQSFFERISAVAKQITPSYEIIFVNDGSPDQSLELAKGLDGPVKIIDLSRNFGHHKAILTGLRYARGRHVFLLDSDLEEPPEALTEFWQKIQGSDADVVFGVQEKRKRGFFENLSGRAFYFLFNFLSEHQLPANLIHMRIMTSRYVKSLLLHHENEILIAGLWAITGYKQVPFPVEKENQGKTTYTLTRKLSMLLTSITSFSTKPLHLIFLMGIFMLFVSFLAIAYYLTAWMYLGDPVRGYTSVILSLWFFGGLNLFAVGLVGIYLSKLYLEAKKRPVTIVREIFENNESHD